MLFVDFCFFFKQKTAYEMRISDWSSDVCSSDLQYNTLSKPSEIVAAAAANVAVKLLNGETPEAETTLFNTPSDRKSVVTGTSVSVRVDPGGRRIIKTKTHVTLETDHTMHRSLSSNNV